MHTHNNLKANNGSKPRRERDYYKNEFSFIHPLVPILMTIFSRYGINYSVKRTSKQKRETNDKIKGMSSL